MLDFKNLNRIYLRMTHNIRVRVQMGSKVTLRSIIYDWGYLIHIMNNRLLDLFDWHGST